MTVETTARKQSFAGGQADLTFLFKVLPGHPEHVKVKTKLTATGVETELDYTTDYTVDLEDDGVGGVATVSPTFGTEYTYIVYRETVIKQESDYDDYNQFPADTLEKDLDRQTMINQEQGEDLARSVKMPIGSSVTDLDFPAPEADRYIGWNSDADALENKDNEATAAADSAAEAEASAAAAAISAAAASGVTGTFDDGDLSSGVLTITHSLGLASPYVVDFLIVDNNQQIFEPDSVTFGENTIEVDISSYGSITGTWGYLYGGSPTTTINVPDPTGETAGDLLKVNSAQDAYELFTPSYLTANNIVEDASPQLGGDLDLNSYGIDFPTVQNVTDCLDEDDMASDSDTKLCTQQSIKAYADARISVAQAGDNLQASADTARSNDTTPDVKVKEIYLPKGGTFRIKFDLYSEGTNTARGTIYRNGVAVGTQQTVTSATPETKSEDIGGWSAGDLCQVYVRSNNTGKDAFIENFRIYELYGSVFGIITD